MVLEIARMVVSAGYVLFLPGLVLSFVFFGRGAIDIIERLALSFALSIAVVPLVVFYLNLAGVKISFWSVVIEVLGIIVIAGLTAWLVSRRRGANLAGVPAATPAPSPAPVSGIAGSRQWEAKRAQNLARAKQLDQERREPPHATKPKPPR